MIPRIPWFMCRVAAMLLALPAALAPGIATCGEPPKDATAETLRFRRVFGPADRLKEWLPGQVKYMPIEPAEFQRLLTLVSSRLPDAAAPAAAQVVAADYEARLSGDLLVAGQASLKVTHTGKKPTLLSLDPCSLAVGKATWAGAKPLDAALGLDADTRLAALVAQPGQLHFEWSLEGRREPADTLTFALAVPACPINRFALDVPDPLAVQCDRGLVQELGWVDEGVRRWQIELGGCTRFRLRIAPARAAPASPALPLVRTETLAYDISVRGIDLSAQLEFETQHDPLEQFTVALDPGLQLLTARYGDALVPWSIVSPAGQAETKVALTLPEPVQEDGRLLKLTAWAPVETNRLSALPRIRPERVLWQEGSATVSISAPLVAKQMTAVDGRQSGTHPLPAPRAGESAQFQYFTPDATVQVHLTRRAAAVQLASGTALVLGGREATARIAADFRASAAAGFFVEADVGPSWQIDAVESVPPGAVEDWFFDKDRLPGNRRRLHVGLTRGLSPEQPLRLAVTAHRPRPLLGQQVAIEELVPLRFRVSGDARRLVSIRAVEPYQLQYADGDRLRTIDPRKLEADAQQLFARPLRGLFFEDDAGASAVQVGLERGKLKYEATVQAEVTVDGDLLHEDYRLQCQPESAGLQRVLVHFSQRREAPLRWTLVGAEDEAPSARLLGAEEQTEANLDPEQETWQVLLPRPQDAPFELHAVRSSRLAGIQPVGLTWLPEATNQPATLVVRGADGAAVQITNRRLKAVPGEPALPGQCQTLRGNYAYLPSREVLSGPEPALSVARGDAANMPDAWIWNCSVESWYEADGCGRHVARFRLQHRGGGRLLLNLPPGVTAEAVRGLWLGERPLAWPSAADTDEDVATIDLPPEKKFPTVTLEFVTAGRGLGIAGSVEPPLPPANLPVLSRHWTVWLPPGYRSLDDDARWQPLGLPQTSWRQRLFGVLGQTADDTAFDPASPGQWLGNTPERAARQAALQEAERLLESLGTVAGSEGAPHDWAGLMDRAGLEAARLEVLIDRHALTRAGVTPPTRPPAVAGPNALACGIDLLQKANLVVLVSPHAVLLTGRQDAAMWHAWLETVEHRGILSVRPGSLAEQLRQAAGTGDGEFVAVKTWRQQPAEAAMPWLRSRPADVLSAEAAGWTAYRTEIADAPSARLSFVHDRSLQLFGAVSFLMVLAIGWWQAGGRRLLMVCVAGGFGALALVLPEGWFTIASGGLLGSVSCLALELIRRPRGQALPESAAESAAKAPSTLTPAGSPVLMILALAGACLLCRTVRGAETAEKPAAPPPIYDVFVPLDEQQQPTGDRYFLPAEFYSQLHRRAVAATKEPQAWLIGGAIYRGELVREADSNQLHIAEIKATFELHTLSPTARVRLPLPREGAGLLPDGTELDGQAVQADWDAEGRALVFDVAEAGRHRLELALRPTMHSAAASAGFDLTIARAANSRLELLIPDNVPEIGVPTAIGAVRLEEEPRQLTAELGPAPRLSVRWPTAAAAAGNGPAVDVEELVWLKVNPGSVIVDARLKIHVVEGQLRQLALSADPRLRPLQVKGDEVKAVEGRAMPGQPQSIVLQWPRPVAGNTVVEARFLLTGTSGVGRNLRLPHFDVLDARATRRWLAVSVDPTLSHDESAADPLEAVAPADFVAAWGKADPPLFAFRRGVATDAWSMSTRPREPQTAVEQTLAASFAEEHTEVDFRAELLTGGGSQFQLHLAAPPKLIVERLSLVEDDVERAARWSQEDDGRITVFLNGPVTGRQTCTLTGRLPVPPRKKPSLPWISVERAQVRAATLHLYRQPSVRVEPLRGAGLVDIGGPPAETRPPQWGRWFQSLRAEGSQPPKALPRVVANQPRLHAEQVTWLYRGAEAWNADIECRLVISGGVLDELRFDAPDALSGPYRASLPAEVKVIDTPDDRRQLIVTPAAPLEGEVRFRLSSSVAIAAGQRVVVPRVVITGLKDVKRLVALPKAVQGQAVTWETQGFGPGELPTGFGVPDEAGPALIYEVVDEPNQAIMRLPEHAGGVARVHLADIRVAWQTDETYRGVAAFDLEPGRLVECPLWMPQGGRLLHVTVGDVPVAPVPDGADAWRIPLGSARLPQRIEVAFAGTLPDRTSAARRRFDAPMPGNLRVLQTLWTVAGPEEYAVGELEGGETQPAWFGELARLKSAAMMLQLSAAFGDEDAPGWYRLWARRVLVAQRGFQRELLPAARTRRAGAAAAEAQAIEQEQWQLAERLGATDTVAQVTAEAEVADKLDEVARCGICPGRAVARYAFAEGVGSIALEYRRIEHPGLVARWLAAFCLIAALPLAVIGVRQPRFRWWLKKWPQAFGVLAGLAWWLWLWPSALGWGIALASLAAAAWPTWRIAPPPPPSSVISLRTLPR